MKFRVSLDFSTSIEAEDDEAAKDRFIHEQVYAPQTDFATWVMDRIKVEPEGGQPPAVRNLLSEQLQVLEAQLTGFLLRVAPSDRSGDKLLDTLAGARRLAAAAETLMGVGPAYVCPHVWVEERRITVGQGIHTGDTAPCTSAVYVTERCSICGALRARYA